MASRAVATTTIVLLLNLLFFTMVSSTYCPPPPPPKPKPHPSCPPPPPPKQKPHPSCPPPPPPKQKPHPSYPTPVPSSKPEKCPQDTLKLGVCVDLLNNLLNVTIGTPPTTPCCSLIHGLVDLEAAICLCTTIKASVLGINLNIPVHLSLLLNHCGKNVPQGFQCA